MKLRLLGAAALVVVSVAGCAESQDGGGRALPPGQQEEAERILSFVAEPAEALPGEPVVLSWTVVGPKNMRLEVVGLGEVARSGSVTVYPTTDTNYMLRIGEPGMVANKGLAIVPVRMRPSISPAGGAIAPGQLQTFRMPGFSEAISWTTGGGALETETLESPTLRWRAPLEPGEYEIRARSRDGREALARVEVRETDPTPARLRGIGGQGPVPGGSFVLDHGGDLYVAGQGIVLRWKADANEWISLGRNDPHEIELVLAPDGALWGYGHEGIVRYDGANDRWQREPAPGSSVVNLFFDGSGNQVATTWDGWHDRSAFVRAAGSSTWEPLELPEGRIVGGVTDAGGKLWVRLWGDGGGESIALLAVDARSVDTLLPAPAGESLDRLQAGASGAIYTWGYAIWRIVPGQDHWEDLSEGLPSDCRSGSRCRIFGLVERGDRLVIATEDGIFVREAGGTFTRSGPLPFDWEHQDVEARDVGGGKLLLVTRSAAWLQRPGSEEWAPFEGHFELPANPRFLDFAVGEDGSAFAATQIFGSPFPALLYRLDGNGRWAPLALELERGPWERVDGLVPLRDGSVVFSFHETLYRVAAGGTRAEEMPGPEGMRVEEFTGNASQLLARAGGRLYRMSHGETTWTPLPVPAGIRSMPRSHGDRVFAATGQGLVELDASGTWQRLGTWGPTGAIGSVAVDRDGKLWIAGDEGAWRLDGERWTPVGMGGCADRAWDLAFLPDGRILCSAANHLVQLDSSGAWVPVKQMAVAGMATRPDGKLLLALRDTGVFTLE